MKKRMTLTINGDVYDKLQGLDRRVSVSEVVSVLLKTFLEEFKRGHFMNDEELDGWIKANPELKDFRERLQEHWGPSVYAVDEAQAKITGKRVVKINKPGKKKSK